MVHSLVRGANKAAVTELVKMIGAGQITPQLQGVLSRYRTDSEQKGSRFSWERMVSIARLIWISWRRGQDGGSGAAGKLRAAVAGNQPLIRELQDWRRKASQISIDYLKERMNSENRKEVLQAIQYYSVALNWMDLTMERDTEFRDSLNDYRKQAFVIQRQEIGNLLEQGFITERTARELQEGLLCEEILEIAE